MGVWAGKLVGLHREGYAMRTVGWRTAAVCGPLAGLLVPAAATVSADKRW